MYAEGGQATEDVIHDWEEMRGQKGDGVERQAPGRAKELKQGRGGTRGEELPRSMTYFSEGERKHGG